MDMDSFDLEELDDDEREELEAMLYAQVHHAAPDAAVTAKTPPLQTQSLESGLARTQLLEPELPPPDPPPRTPDQVVSSVTETEKTEAFSSLTNGYGHVSPVPSGLREGKELIRPFVNEEKEPAPKSLKEKKEQVSKTERTVNASTCGVSSITKRAVIEQKWSEGLLPDAELSRHRTAETNASEPIDNGEPSTSTSPDASTSKLPIPPSSEPGQPPDDHQFQSTTATLQDPVPPSNPSAPAVRPPKRPLSPLASDEEPETKSAALAAGERRRRRRRRRLPELVTVHSSSSGSSTDEFVVDADGRGRSGGRGTAPAAAGTSSDSPPEIVAIDESQSSAPEVISLAEDSLSSPKPSTSAGTSSATVVTIEDELTAGRPPKKRSATSSPAPSPGRVGTPRRPRTSSDISSSDEDSDGGATLVADCDITMNVRGAGAPSIAWTEEVLAERMISERLTLPLPACRRVLSSPELSEAERRRLEPLCSSRPCYKWSERQRAGYSTPRDYGSGDVARIQATMSDHGWDIPVHYLQRAGEGRSVRARYYSNLMKNRCRRCDDIGHVMAACPLPPVCHLCGVRGHTADYRCPNMFCFMCGQRNHPTQRCPRHVQPVFCALCKASGHTSEHCSDRWRRFHATTVTGWPLRPPASLENRPSSQVYCWQCGAQGHHGHHCGDERYTSAASLSQQVISYTETACPSREVSGILATPQQMDVVFRPKRRRRLERDTGARLTYERLGGKAWLINISGSLEAAQAAHEQVLALVQGRKRPRPRPNSAPASPVHPSQTAGAKSAPVSPEPVKEVQAEDGGADSRLDGRERRRLKKLARRAERRRQARAGAGERSPPPVVDVESNHADVVEVEFSRSDDDCVEVPPKQATAGPSEEVTAGPSEGVTVVTSEEVTVVGEVTGPPARVELVTIVSDDDCDGSDDADDAPRSAAERALEEAQRVWRLRILEGEQQRELSQDQMSSEAVNLSKQQRKRMRKKLRKALLASGEGAPSEAPSVPDPSSALANQTSSSTPSTSQNSAKTSTKRQKQREKSQMIEMLLADKTKSSLDPELLNRLPQSWEKKRGWRKRLISNGVDPSLIATRYTKAERKGVSKWLGEKRSAGKTALPAGKKKKGGKGPQQNGLP